MLNNRKFRFTLFILHLVLNTNLFAQSNSKTVEPPIISDFSGTLKFLASGWMEGREAGAKGSFIAADYIASMMEQYRLVPFKKAFSGNPGIETSNYFQDFNLISYKNEKSSVAIIQKGSNFTSIIQLADKIEYQANALFNSCDMEAPLVFVGYGISNPEKGYDDYKNLDVKGKIVIAVDGFPGCMDKSSIAWQKLGEFYFENDNIQESKLKFAKNHGAIALIILHTNENSFVTSSQNFQLLNNAMSNAVVGEPEYIEDNYILPMDLKNGSIPTFNFSKAAGLQLLVGTGIDLTGFEKNAARLISTTAVPIKDKTMHFLIDVKSKSVLVRNVIGILPGQDTSKYIIIGGHYDHLGTRNGAIYNGADDNASGAAGMLALAKKWSESGLKPNYSLIFASWTAEEKGLLGSRYFTQTITKNPENILLYINMDMISRSVVEDSAHNQLSIGTRIQDKALKEMAVNINSQLKKPFILDLWDVSGHSGSDYASFTERDIPVYTFNTGLHNDYHTPRDISHLADFNKMADVLKIVNNIILQFSEIQR